MKLFKKLLIIIFSIAIIATASIYAIWHNEIATVASIKTIINQDLSHDDGYTYEMYVSGDYYFEDFLKQGGATNDAELIQFVTDHITKGLIPMTIKSKEIACSSFTAWTEDKKFVFGRNYDFDQTNTAIVHTSPKGRHASISTIDLQFLGIKEESGISSIKEKALLLAAPYIPLDGINDAGVACGIYMTYQGEPTTPTNQNTDKPDITSTTLLRLILDYADSVDEAIELASKYDMHDSAGTSYHYMVADKEGNSAILEWTGETDITDIDGSKREFKVTKNTQPFQVVTNFIVQPGYYPTLDEAKGHDRYEFLTNKLTETNGIIVNNQAAMDLLQGVGRRTWIVDGDQTKGTTVHSAVYNLTDLTSYWIANEHWNSAEHTFNYSLQK